MIRDALCRLGDAFEPDYLAYAALTGKIEKELCTSLAWCIRRLSDVSETKVVREWRSPKTEKQIDLAVLRDSKLCALIEAKQWRDFDFAKWSDPEKEGPKNPCNHTAKDIERLRAEEIECKRYILSFCVHCCPIPSQQHDKEIKYLREMIGFGVIDESQIVNGFERLRYKWGSPPVEAADTIRAGKASNTNVIVYYWLMDVR